MKSIFTSIIIVAVLFTSCKQSGKKEEVIKMVKYEKLIYSSSSRTHTFSGVVKAKSETNLSFKVGGTLSQVNVKLGDRVKKGRLIASIDPIDFNIQKDQAMAQKNSAESQLMNARSTFERVEKLYENNSVSLSEYEKAKTSLVSAESQLEGAEKQLEAANNQVSYTKLYAPTDGIISAVNIAINEVVQAGRTVIVMNSEDKNDMEVEVGIPERYIKDIQNGDEVEIRISSMYDAFRGIVTEVAYTSSKTGVTYPVTLSLDTKGNKSIRPDMPAEVTFRFGSSNQESFLVAPLKAVASGVDGNYIFRLVPDKENGVYIVEKVTIELGDINENGYIIREGLNEGDLVVVAGLQSMYDGRKVKLLNE
jgi:RND family efflux transporter MFP subunit